MASALAKAVSQRIFKESVANKFGLEDPYFEHVPATRLDGRPNGKLKKRKKALPPGISDHDGKVLTKVKRRAYRLDMCLFNFLGIRFGWSSVIGLIPAAGDSLDAFMALMVFKTCCQVEGGLPSSLKFWMLVNIIVDFFIGLVPILGDIADALFRANTRNAMLLERHLREKGKKELRKSGQPIPAVDPSNPDEYDRAQREERPRKDSSESSSSSLREHEKQRSAGRDQSKPADAHAHAHAHAYAGPRLPDVAHMREGQSEGARFFERFERYKARMADLEMGGSDAYLASQQNSRRYERQRQQQQAGRG